MLTDRAADVLAFVRERGVAHPREVQAHLGHEPIVNAWGGQSSATTVDLERLRHYGYLRVADRVNGVRRYEAAQPLGDPLDPAERLRTLALVVARLLAPRPEASLSGAVKFVVPWMQERDGNRGARPAHQRPHRSAVTSRLRTSKARVTYGPPNWCRSRQPPRSGAVLGAIRPVVWDRRRFGQAWGWDYRFEAYTPVPKRVLGYYAMPLLWREQVIGWANCAGVDSDVEIGYVDGEPKGTPTPTPSTQRSLG